MGVHLWRECSLAGIVGYMSWLSSMLTNSFTALPGVLMYVSYMGELTVWIVFPTVAIRIYRFIAIGSIVQLSNCSCMFL